MHKYTARTLALEIFLIVVAVLFVSPLYIMINVALKQPKDIARPMVPANPPTMENLQAAWTEANLGNALLNTTIVSALSIAIIVVVSSTAGYMIARSATKLSRGAFLAFLAGLLLPFQLATIPLYQLMQSLNLLGTLWSLVLQYSGGVPFSVFLYAAFLRGVPRDYEEAAQVDGAGPIRTFFLVVFPMMKAVTGTIIILSAVSLWNDFFTPRLYLAGSPYQTVTVALYQYVGQYTTQWQLIFGGLLIASVPIVTLFVLLQRRVIEGFAGGLKG